VVWALKGGSVGGSMAKMGRPRMDPKEKSVHLSISVNSKDLANLDILRRHAQYVVGLNPCNSALFRAALQARVDSISTDVLEGKV